jgi:hypothetical protein
MRNVLRSMSVMTVAALLLASGSLPSDAVARQQARVTAFDGQWSVVVYTLQGDCDRALRYSVRIVAGRVQADDQSYQAAGVVAPNGTIRVVVAEGGRSASGSGRLSGNSGRGQWRTSSGECAGQWMAERRAANY